MLAAQIKEVTKNAHQQVEKKVVLSIKSIKSEEDYVDLLKRFYAYFSKVEAAVQPYISPQLLPDLASRRNASYIKADIVELGSSLKELPSATIPEITNSSQAMGALYVLEGSIMGGPYIIQMLRKLGINKGFSFFSGYGDEATQKWQSFISALNSVAKTEEDSHQAINSATKTFLHFGEVFS